MIPRPVFSHISKRQLRLSSVFASCVKCFSVSSTTRTSPDDPRIPRNGVSYVQGATSTPLLTTTLGDHWSSIVQKHGDRPALVSRHEKADQHDILGTGKAGEGRESGCLRWSFGEMDEHVDRLARGLLQMGIQKGDRVGVYSQNNSSYAALQWATAKIGAILTTINPAYKMPEVVNALKAVGCKALFIVPSLKKVDIVSQIASLFPDLSSSTPHSLSLESLPDLKSIVLIDNETGREHSERSFGSVLEGLKGCVDYRDLLIRERGIVDKVKEAGTSLSKDDVINLQFTSGTTGLPKSVSLTHYNILNNGFHIGQYMQMTPQDSICNVPPLFHCFGLVLGNLAAWTHGAAIVYPAEGFDPAATIRAVIEERCTALHGVATMFISKLALLEKVEKNEHVPGHSDLKLDFSSLRTGIAAGSPVPHETMRKIMSVLNLKEQTIAYGMTETSPVTFQTTTTDPLIKRTHTVGQVLPHIHAKIVTPLSDPSLPNTLADAPPLPLGEPGELLVSGYPLQKGYWGNKEETEKVMVYDHDGRRWMCTGDICKMDEEGYVSVVGRSKDVIIRGGENLFPVVIENALLTHPGVADASVVSVPDSFFGEAVGVFVKRREGTDGQELTAEGLVKHIDQSLSHQNAPGWVWWLGEDGVAEEYPLTASGKIRKVDLREWASKLSEQGIGKVASKKKSTTKIVSRQPSEL